MKVILVDQRHGHTKTIVLKGWLKGLLSLCLLGAPVALGYFGYGLAVSQNNGAFSEESAQNWERQIRIQTEQISEIKEESVQQIEALTMRLAMLQARLVRLDAVGERITTIANLDADEFDFSDPIAIGGPAIGVSQSYSAAGFMDAVYQLEQQLEDRRQLQVFIRDSVIRNRAVPIVKFFFLDGCKPKPHNFKQRFSHTLWCISHRVRLHK